MFYVGFALENGTRELPPFRVLNWHTVMYFSIKKAKCAFLTDGQLAIEIYGPEVVRANTSLTLTCALVVTFPEVYFSWTKEKSPASLFINGDSSHPIDANENEESFSISTMKTSSVLVVHQTSFKDSGRYVCSVRSGDTLKRASKDIYISGEYL